MNIVPSNPKQTINSLEIAELTGKRHGHVIRDIENMLTQLKIGLSEFASTYYDASGRACLCYELPPREVKILITGYDVVRRAKVIDRLEVLEKVVAQAPALSPVAAELREFMEIGQVLGVPLHLAQSEGVKMLRAIQISLRGQ